MLLVVRQGRWSASEEAAMVAALQPLLEPAILTQLLATCQALPGRF